MYEEEEEALDQDEYGEGAFEDGFDGDDFPDDEDDTMVNADMEDEEDSL